MGQHVSRIFRLSSDKVLLTHGARYSAAPLLAVDVTQALIAVDVLS
jgi:hypothetical protein